MKTTLGSQVKSILDFERDMDRVDKMIKQVTPDAAEAVRSLARSLGTGLNIKQNKSL